MLYVSIFLFEKSVTKM